MESYYTLDELKRIGFAYIGESVQVSRRAAIYSPDKIRLGNHVRIDDFVFLSGGVGIEIGNYVHVAVQAALYGSHGIHIGSYVNLSGRVSIYSTSDDYSGEYMRGPLVPQCYIHDSGAPVEICNHAIIGAGTVVLPGVTIGEGSSIGALSLVKESTEPFGIYAGVPARKIKEGSRKMLELENLMIKEKYTGGGASALRE